MISPYVENVYFARLMILYMIYDLCYAKIYKILLWPWYVGDDYGGWARVPCASYTNATDIPRNECPETYRRRMMGDACYSATYGGFAACCYIYAFMIALHMVVMCKGGGHPGPNEGPATYDEYKRLTRWAVLGPLVMAAVTIPQLGLGTIIKQLGGNSFFWPSTVPQVLHRAYEIYRDNNEMTEATEELAGEFSAHGSGDDAASIAAKTGGFMLNCFSQSAVVNFAMSLGVFVFPPVVYVLSVGHACGLVSSGAYDAALVLAIIMAIFGCLALPCCQCLTCYKFVPPKTQAAREAAWNNQFNRPLEHGLDGRPLASSRVAGLGGNTFIQLGKLQREPLQFSRPEPASTE